MPASERRYCIVGIHYADRPDVPEIMAINGKIVVFDTPSMAHEILPRLGCGRQDYWDATREICCFSPILQAKDAFNRLSIWTGYDPYDVPGGFRSKGVWSESEGRDWKYHVYWNHVLPELLLWADDLATRFDPYLIPRD